MLVVECPRRAELLLLSVLALAPAAAPAQTGEPVIVRLNDVVGDTLDLAERDSFHLFPNTAGFQQAVILARPGPELYAEVALAAGDTTRRLLFRLMPTQLERIRFVVDNREYLTEQLRSNPSAGPTLASFWKAIEDQPLQRFADEPASVAPASGSRSQPATCENRYNYTLHGTTLGSCAGSCIGSRTSVELVGYVNGPYIDCGPGGYVQTPVYSINHPVFWTAACGLTALGSAAGYMIGDKLDRKALAAQPPPTEGNGQRTSCAIGAAIPGILLGTGFAILAGGLHFRGTGDIENDPQGLTMLPMVLTGLCIAVELTTIGYRIGRAIDRRKAEEAKVKRRALGH